VDKKAYDLNGMKIKVKAMKDKDSILKEFEIQ
jgi:hypothetical protein